MKTLLIAIGCSSTAGTGCYEPGAVVEFQQDQDLDKLIQRSQASYAQFSWPRQVADGMGWDVVNLGVPGGSNSGSVKHLYAYEPTEDYDQVHVIFMVTEKTRFSVYGHGRVQDYSPARLIDRKGGLWVNNLHDNQKKLMEYWLLTQDIETEQEAKFYIQAAAACAASRGWRFNWVPAFTPYEYTDCADMKTTMGLTHSCAQLCGDDDKSHCGHPNRHGYSKIADRMVAALKRLWPQ